MAGRGRGADDLDGDQPIELIEPGGAAAETTGETVEAAGVTPSSLAIGLASLIVIVIVALALTSTGDDNSAPPSTTEPDTPFDESASTARSSQLTQPLLGAGPDLQWDRIIWNVGTDQFTWIDDAFVGDDGITEWSIRPSVIGPTIGQRQSILLAYPDYYIVSAAGARILAPRVDQPDHLLVFSDGIGAEPMRVELTVQKPVTDLIRRRHVIEAAVIGDVAVVVVTQFDVVDDRALGERVGRDLPEVLGVRVFDDRLSILVAGDDGVDQAVDFSFDDVAFTATERASFQSIGSSTDLITVDLTDGSTGPSGIVPDWIETLSVAGDRFVLEWYSSAPPGFVSTSTNGTAWAPTRDFAGVGNVDGEGSALFGELLTTDIISRSVDGARTWDRIRAPLGEFDLTAVGSHVALVEVPTGVRNDPNEGDTYRVALDDYDLVISAVGGSFELVDSDTGEVVSSGVIDDSAGGAAYDPFDGALVITDPEGGGTLTVSQSQLWLASNTTVVPPETSPQLAFALWDGDQAPEWRVEALADLFGTDAFRVQFVGGDGHLLAVATTPNGYHFYLAEIS